MTGTAFVVSVQKLTSFVAEAVAHTYAADVEALSNSWTPGFKELGYPSNETGQDGWPEAEWYYCDSYAGFYQAPGREVVYHNQIPVWSRVYHGGMQDLDFLSAGGQEAAAKETFRFLKRVLKLVDRQRPYWRGPSSFPEGDWRYESEVEGDIVSFRGRERIFYQDVLVFEQWYGGGIILQKDTQVVSQ